MKQRVLVVTRIPFWLLGAGERMRLLALLWTLGLQTELTILFLGEIGDAQRQRIQQLNVRCSLVQVRGKGGIEAERTALNQLCRHQIFDTCIFQRIGLHVLLEALPTGIRTALDTHDLESVNAETRRTAGQAPANTLTFEEELTILARFDRVLLIQSEDHALVAQRLGPKALLVPHPVSFSYLPVQPDRFRLGLVGSAWAANLDGLDWFADNVWPKISHPAAELHLFGWISDVWRPTYKAFLRHGFVADFKRAWGSIDVAINPVRWGSGLKIKSVEALGHGLPLVSTSEGARGLRAAEGSGLVIADEAGEFADACSRLLADASQRLALGGAGYRFANQHFSARACFGALMQWLTVRDGAHDN